jgi:hypothetical protein
MAIGRNPYRWEWYLVSLCVALFIAWNATGCAQQATSPDGLTVVPEDLPVACQVVTIKGHVENRSGETIENWGRNQYPVLVAQAKNIDGRDILRDPGCLTPLPFTWGDPQGADCYLDGDSGSDHRPIKCVGGGPGSTDVCMRRDNRTRGVCTTINYHVVE